jgi:hypothetical protein
MSLEQAYLTSIRLASDCPTPHWSFRHHDERQHARAIDYGLKTFTSPAVVKYLLSARPGCDLFCTLRACAALQHHVLGLQDEVTMDSSSAWEASLTASTGFTSGTRVARQHAQLHDQPGVAL